LCYIVSVYETTFYEPSNEARAPSTSAAPNWTAGPPSSKNNGEASPSGPGGNSTWGPQMIRTCDTISLEIGVQFRSGSGCPSGWSNGSGLRSCEVLP